MTNQEIIAVIQAYEEGKAIESSIKDASYYVEIENPSWNFSEYDYRVKPEPEPPKYEPFTSEDDLVGAIVKNSNNRAMISCQSKYSVHISGYLNPFTYESLMDNWTFADGKPCGKLVQQ